MVLDVSQSHELDWSRLGHGFKFTFMISTLRFFVFDLRPRPRLVLGAVAMADHVDSSCSPSPATECGGETNLERLGRERSDIAGKDLQ